MTAKTKLWNENEKEALRVLVREGYSLPEIAKKMGRSYESAANAKRRYFVEGETREAVRTQYSVGFDKNVIINAIKEKLLKVSPIVAPKIKKRDGSGDTLIVHFTDWHMGKKIKDEHGNIIFDESVCKKRVGVLTEQILSLLDNHINKGIPIKDVCFFITGDMCDGMGIFASQEFQSEMAPPLQVMSVCEVIQSIVLSLVKRGLSVKIYGVKGNHGEIRENGKAKDPNANWDLMVYLILDFWIKTMLKNNSVVIEYSELDYLNCKVNGWHYHLRHIAPQQSETSSGKAKFLAWSRMHKCDALVYGHYHHWGMWDRSSLVVFRGGSITGIDEFAEKISEESQPTQLVWGCSKKRPLTFSYAVDLGEKKRG